MIKVALIQRICTHYRLPVFRNLAQRDGIDLTVYFGRGQKSGSQQNAKDISGFNYKRLFTLSLPLQFRDRNYYVVFHPTLLFHLIWSRYDVVICEGASNLINNIFVVLYCLLAGIPFIWWDSGRKPGFPRSIQRKLADPLLHFMAKKAMACLAYGSIARDYLESVGIPSKRIFIAQNAIDTEQVRRDLERYDKYAINQKRKELAIEGKKVILYVGALEKRKKLRLLFEAFKSVEEDDSSVALLVIGDGPERSTLEVHVIRGGITGIHFLGRIVEGIGIYFIMADVVVITGLAGLAIHQAMAYGTLAVAPKVGGPEYELIEEGKTGFLIQQSTVSEIAGIMRKATDDPGLCAEMGATAKKLIHEKFNIKNMVRGIVQAVEYAFGC